MSGKSLKTRVLSVDILRGMTVCFMIIVNNGAGKSFPFLRHAQWNGMTPCDMVFPFFLFIMGVSIALASQKSFGEILRRTVSIILVCWAIFWFGCILDGDWLPLEHFRFPGVLVRIALSYCAVALLSKRLSPGWLAGLAAALLGVYSLLLLTGNGYVNDETNIVSRVDRALLGIKHLYMQRPIDPEGILGLIPSVAHTILGYLCGRMFKGDYTPGGRAVRMSVYGLALLAAGLAVKTWLPLNKTIWSPSFVLVTCGSAAFILALFSLLLDGNSRKSYSSGRPASSQERAGFFRVFGVNPLALYALSEVLATLSWHFGIPRKVSGFFRGFLPPEWASLTYALLFMLVCWSAGLLLYKKKLYIRL